MKFLLDTDICIYLMKTISEKLMGKFRAIPGGEIGISAVSVCELQYGVAKSGKPVANQIALDGFLRDFEILPFPQSAALQYGRLRAALEKSGKPIAGMDILIAAHALDIGAHLVTNNKKEFSRVPGLKTEYWVEDSNR